MDIVEGMVGEERGRKKGREREKEREINDSAKRRDRVKRQIRKTAAVTKIAEQLICRENANKKRADTWVPDAPVHSTISKRKRCGLRKGSENTNAASFKRWKNGTVAHDHSGSWLVCSGASTAFPINTRGSFFNNVPAPGTR